MRLLLCLSLLAVLAAGEAPRLLPPMLVLPSAEAQVIDPQGRAVMVPYEQFLSLWKKLDAPEATAAPPLPGAALTAWRAQGRLDEHGIEAQVELDLANVRTQPDAVLVRGLAITGHRAPDGVLVRPQADGVLIHLPGAGRWKVPVDIVAAAAGAEAVRSAVLPLPEQDGVLTLVAADPAWRITPDAGVLRHQEASATGAVVRLAGVRGGQALRWTRPVVEVAAEPLLIADTATVVTVQPRGLGIDSLVQVDVQRQPVSELRLEVPPRMQVLNVAAPGLRTWDRAGDQVVLGFHAPAGGRVAIVLRSEQELPDGATLAEIVPPRLIGAARQGGQLSLRAGEGLSLDPRPGEGWVQIDASAISPDTVAAYRSARGLPPLAFALTRLASDIRAELQQLVRIESDEDRMQLWLGLDVRKAGLFTVALAVGAEWELVDLPQALIDEARPSPARDGQRTIELVLRARLLGSQVYPLQFRRASSLSRDQQARSATVAAIGVVGARTQRGLIAVTLPEGWASAIVHRDGVSAADPLRVAQAPWNVHGRIGEQLAFTWIAGVDGVAAPALGMELAPRAQEVVLRQHERIELDDAQIRRSVSFAGEVRHRPLDALVVAAPSAWDGLVVFSGVAESRVVDRAGGWTRWELRLGAPVQGPLRVAAQVTLPMPPLPAARAATLALPAWRCQATRLECVTALARSGNLEASIAAPDSEALAVGDLPQGLRGEGVVAGFQSGQPRDAVATVTRHDLIPLAQAGIGRIDQMIQVSQDGVARVRSILRIDSRGLPHLDIALPPRTRILEATLDGRPARLSARGEDHVIVPLGQPGPHVLALVSEQRLDAPARGWHRGRVELPRFGQGEGDLRIGVDVQRISLSLPEAVAITGWDPSCRVLGEGQLPADQQAEALRPLGLSIPVDPAGRVWLLQRIGDGGTVGWSAVPGRALDALGLIAAAAMILAAWFLRRRGPALGLLAMFAVGAWAFCDGPWRVLAHGLAWGALIGLAAALLPGLAARWRSHAAARAVDGDPLLKDGP